LKKRKAIQGVFGHYDVLIGFVDVRISNEVWTCSEVYASPNLHLCSQLWDHLRSVNLLLQHPWVAIGDTNDTISPPE